MFSIEQQITAQRELEGEKLTPVKPLETPINAKPHTAIYKMHRYYARRPWNVFKQMIEHYTLPGEIILDPFCGGGVTVVEGLKAKRKVIGVDLNPLAIFITKTQVESLEIEAFQKIFIELTQKVKNTLLEFYKTPCRACGYQEALVNWYEWSNIFACPQCGAENVIDSIEKHSAGKYRCQSCHQVFAPSQAVKTGEKLVRLSIECPECQHSDLYEPLESDIELSKHIAENFDRMVIEENLWYPQDAFPDGDLEKDHSLFKKGFTHFYKLFTKRNLLLTARLLKAIKEYPCSEIEKKFLYLCFGGTLRFANRMCFRNEAWRGKSYLEWAKHAYWMPNVFVEGNVFFAFKKHFNKILQGKKESNRVLGDFYHIAADFAQINDQKTCLLLNQSSHDIPLPSQSIDCIITDPPFGGNVQYAELSNFWVVWLRDVLGINGIIDNTLEVIQTRHSGFATAKALNHYENMLYQVFAECYRVLKPSGWMVMTFHNKDVNVWMALHRAASRAGFKLPSYEESEQRGMLYQPPIELYTTTIHQRATGSMLGDFILSFKRVDRMDDLNKIRKTLSAEQEDILIHKITQLITYHGGADDNTIMTCLIPALNELNILHQVASFDWEAFLANHFIKDKKTQKWYTKKLYQLYYDEGKKRLRPVDYIPAEEVTKNLLFQFLQEKKFATMDELLGFVYSQLVNSHRPGIEAIQSFIIKFCELATIKDKKGYILTTDKKMDSSQKIEQLGIFGEEPLAQNLSHNQIIELIAQQAIELNYQVHVGKTEQRKEKALNKISIKMNHKEDYGIASETAFKKIKEIDLLLIQKSEIPIAFEVTTTISTAREAINDRFRELFAILPNTRIQCFIVVKDEDFAKAAEMINSVANVKESLASKVKPIKLSALTKESLTRLLQ